MATLFVRHRVDDYAKWRQVYDTVGPMQKRFGVTAEAVYQTDDDPNDVTVMHEFKSAAEAKAMIDAAELREVMTKAGVSGPPTIWITSKA